MKIVDINNTKIRGCFVFVVGNCEISVSTIFDAGKPEIAIFNKHSGTLEKDKLTTIQDAINWVNNFGTRD